MTTKDCESLLLSLLFFSRSVMSDSLQPPVTAAPQSSLSFTISLNLLKLMSIDSVVPSNHLILCRPLLLLPSIFPNITGFSNDLVLCIRWPKHWSFSFSISLSNQYSGLISFRIDWFDLAVQRTLESLLQHHSSEASILRCLAFFMVQLSLPYMITGKTTALTEWTFVGKVMSLIFNMLSRLVIAFLPRSKCLSILWLQSPSAVILEPKKIKSVNVSYVLKIYIKMFTEGLPWWSSDWDSKLLTQGPQVWSLVGRLGPAHHNRKTPHVTAKIQCSQEIK